MVVLSSSLASDLAVTVSAMTTHWTVVVHDASTGTTSGPATGVVVKVFQALVVESSMRRDAS